MRATDRIPGKRITLRPATMDDREVVYQWLAHSDISNTMFGPPLFPDVRTPSWEDFIEDYLPHYFDGSEPLAGRSFIIEFKGTPVGHVNYNAIYPGPSTELDIWMASRQFTGHGYGTDALTRLCRYLHHELQCLRYYIGPSERNTHAIRSYRKAGFVATADIPEWFVADYADVIVLCKVMP